MTIRRMAPPPIYIRQFYPEHLESNYSLREKRPLGLIATPRRLPALILRLASVQAQRCTCTFAASVDLSSTWLPVGLSEPAGVYGGFPHLVWTPRPVRDVVMFVEPDPIAF
jgi:hypothetical protein